MSNEFDDLANAKSYAEKYREFQKHIRNPLSSAAVKGASTPQRSMAYATAIVDAMERAARDMGVNNEDDDAYAKSNALVMVLTALGWLGPFARIMKGD